jgi:phospholipid/cholesterol/gamma-HCH transport system ATP-binding protein
MDAGRGVVEMPQRDERELVRTAATSLLGVAPELAEAIVAHIRAQMPELARLNGDFEPEFRAAIEANVEEIASLLRAQLPPVAIAPVGALAHAQATRRRGVGLRSLARAYELAFAVIGHVLDCELERSARVTDFLELYTDRVLTRLAEAYEASEPESLHASGDPSSDGAASENAARAFMASRRMADSSDEAAERARAHCRRVLERFRDSVGEAAADPRLSRRLARAETTAVVALADEPDLAVTLLLDRAPIEVLDGWRDAECRLEIASADLARLGSDEVLAPMAIAGGRIAADGAVRKLMLVWPILQELTRSRPGEPVEEQSGFSAHQRRLLDEAAEHAYAHHEGALEVSQSRPGDFWSIECVDVYKRFGSNQVLNGLNLGIPEGMITVVLGPSGTGKSVLINHLIGLMYPDQGDILVHGRSVTRMRRRELLELRRKFGILFQDGALFGSMPIYDNVAFPLRQHTNLSESEIREIVMARLEDVGLGKAADRMPSELSGGMRKRAGFARALVLEPEIVMFDEPDSGLDPVRTALLCRLIRQMHREHGGTYVVITHDIASMRAIGEYIAVLWRGRIVQAGEREQMLNSENPFVRQFLAGADVGPLGME